VVFPLPTPQEPIMATPPKRRAVEATGEKVLRYESFISDVLQRDLRKVLDHRDKVYEQLAKYLQLRNVIERLQPRYFTHLCGPGIWFFPGVDTGRSSQVH
uniref:Ubiquitously expressed prefoldin like chaperone n=2 Tax=Platyrrhini TaxID=9479 RepID=A0A2K5RTE7_CEBIM